MTKRQTKKAIYQAIVKDGKSHQQAFDELKSSSEMDLESLANEVSKVPSAAKNEQFKTLVYSYVILLGVIIVLRALGVFGLFYGQNINMNLILLFIALGIVFPVMGIVGALTFRIDSYRSIAIIMILGIVRSFNKEVIDAIDIYFILTLIPFLAVIILAFIIPTKLKTEYTKKVNKTESEGKVKTSLSFVFDENVAIERADLLDI